MAKGKTGITLDDGEYRRKIKAMAKKLKIVEKDLVQEQGALHAIDMAKRTPPFVRFPGGRSIGTKADYIQGVEAISQDLLNICRPKDAGLIDFCAKAFGVGFTDKEIRGRGGRITRYSYARIGRSVQEIHRWHEQHRQPSSGRTFYRQSIKTMWVDEDMLDDYIAWRIRAIGTAKAAFFGAAKKLDPGNKTRAPAWVKKHVGKSGGTGRVVFDSKGPTATYSASAAGLQVPIRSVKRVTSNRLKAMVKRMKYLARQSAKKSGFK
jgi:hypothetical protein